MTQQYGFDKIEVIRNTDNEAMQLLQKLSRNVQPLMNKYKWKVPLLKESDFQDPAIHGMNLNNGQTILIRLRKKGSDSEFMAYEYLLGTLCHELAHNVWGPHDKKFYAFLDELQTYLEILPSNGLSGFDACGYKIGGDSTLRAKINKNSDHDIVRTPASLAADYRSKQQNMFTPAGGVKLGGTKSDKTPAQMAAEAAMKRESAAKHFFD